MKEAKCIECGASLTTDKKESVVYFVGMELVLIALIAVFYGLGWGELCVVAFGLWMVSPMLHKYIVPLRVANE